MFTGIVQAKAVVAAIEQLNSILRYAVTFPPDRLLGLQQGASVAIDGVCQTVVAIDQERVWFEAIEETLNRTTLSQMKVGGWVNLERSARYGDEIGGHLLAGHVFGTARLFKIEKNIYTFECPSPWLKYLFPKGFIAIDGISLTLVEVSQLGRFTVHLIPETLKRTTLGEKQEGAYVNLEFDPMTQLTVQTVEAFLRTLGSVNDIVR